MKENYNVTIRKHRETGTVKGEWWETNDGEFHCPTGPAIRQWDENENLEEELWFNKNGELHREGDKPAWLRIDGKTGVIWEEGYFTNGERDRSRSDLPAWIRRDIKTGHIIGEFYHHKGMHHREGNKPAIILKSPKTGVAYHESVWQMDHCISVIERDVKSGSITYRGPPTEKHINNFTTSIPE